MYGAAMRAVQRALETPEQLAEQRLPWAVHQSWQDLLFAHWKVPSQVARSLVPPHVELDLYEGQAWVTMVPMHMVDVRFRGVPRRLGQRWPEVNFRTYVRAGDQVGTWFLSIDASSRLGAWLGRTWRLPMLHAQLSLQMQPDGWRHLRCDRPETSTHGAARLDVRYRGVGPVRHAEPGTLEHFLAERELMFLEGRRGRLYRGRVWHEPWPLQDAEVELLHNSIPAAAGLDLGEPDRAYFARRADTIAWLPMPQGT